MKDFTALSKEGQEAEYERLKQELKYTEVPEQKYVYITRPVMYETLPRGWEGYIPSIKYIMISHRRSIRQTVIDVMNI